MVKEQTSILLSWNILFGGAQCIIFVSRLTNTVMAIIPSDSGKSLVSQSLCCALCPGVNCGTVLGASECGLGLVWTLHSHSIHYSWKWGPSNVVV